MKKTFSLLLAFCMLFSITTGFSNSVFAKTEENSYTQTINRLCAKKIPQVKIVKSVTTVNHNKQKVTFAAKWKKIKGVDGYQIKAAYLVDNEGSFYKRWIMSKNIKGASNSNYYKRFPYASDVSYEYIKVRAYKKVNGKKIYGKWSKVTESRVKNIGRYH